MQTKLFTGGQFCTNLYIVHNQQEAIIIDPGFADQEIDQFIEQQNLKIKYIILTHAHIDHYLYAGYYRVKYKAKIYCHEADKQQFKRSYSYAKKVVDQFPQNFMNSADIYFNCGQIFQLQDVQLKIIHTPGHTPGSCCLVSENTSQLFTGDTLFSDTIGNYSFPGGSFKDMSDSIHFLEKQNQYYQFLIYPGHSGTEIYNVAILKALDVLEW
ncbi:Hydroxyacylglutathione_hydrolase [Hexamita inflata]|uniref:Hydroxyacylglutathione hydrolase n=1 Tax=Hexamita inflata TaxID=28002 RepID=A0AA86PDX5_9EUKA|nr:Hydroxyacylglutathione hydrolase [Hexamita inflata]